MPAGALPLTHLTVLCRVCADGQRDQPQYRCRDLYVAEMYVINVAEMYVISGGEKGTGCETGKIDLRRRRTPEWRRDVLASMGYERHRAAPKPTMHRPAH